MLELINDENSIPETSFLPYNETGRDETIRDETIRDINNTGALNNTLKPYPLTTFTSEIFPNGISVREACLSDAQAILNIYNHVGISNDNITNKLSISSENDSNSFKNTGGIFKISIDDISNIIHNPGYKILVAIHTDESGEDHIIASYSCAGSSNSYDGMKFNPKESLHSEEWFSEFYAHLGVKDIKQTHSNLSSLIVNNPLIAGSIDSIVLPEFQGKGLTTLLKHEMLQDLLNSGFKYILIEIYTILSASCNGRDYPSLNLRNNPSFKVHENLLSSPIGTMPRPIQEVGDWLVKVKADLLCAKLSDSVNALTRKIATKWNIKK